MTKIWMWSGLGGGGGGVSEEGRRALVVPLLFSPPHNAPLGQAALRLFGDDVVNGARLLQAGVEVAHFGCGEKGGSGASTEVVSVSRALYPALSPHTLTPYRTLDAGLDRVLGGHVAERELAERAARRPHGVLVGGRHLGWKGWGDGDQCKLEGLVWPCVHAGAVFAWAGAVKK